MLEEGKKCCTFTTTFGMSYYCYPRPINSYYTQPQFGVKKLHKTMVSCLTFISHKERRHQADLICTLVHVQFSYIYQRLKQMQGNIGTEQYLDMTISAELLQYFFVFVQHLISRPLLLLSPCALYSICCVHKKSVSGLTYSVLKAPNGP